MDIRRNSYYIHGPGVDEINYCKKIRQLADLKQQISQKMILHVQHIALMSMCCI